jgi:2-C-methyl-D-erythritol 4-phosphate cytidylyltransferase
LIAWSLEAASRAESIAAVVIAAPPGHEAELRAVAPDAEIVPGGTSRSASVRNALEKVETELVLVHDAARPLAPASLFDEIAAALSADASADAVVAAGRVADTLKRAGDDATVTETIDRAAIWAVQTPQGFRSEAIRGALDAPADQLAAATDDASLIELAGGTVRLHAATDPNPKLTTPADLRLVEALLQRRAEGG